MPGFLASLRDLCLFRRGPEEMPYSPNLLVALVLGCVLMEVLFGLHNHLEPALMAGSVVGGIAAIGVLVPLLRSRGKGERFVQIATAMVAVYLLFGIVKNGLALSLPIEAWRHEFMSHPGRVPPMTDAQAGMAFAITLLGIWQVCVWIGALRRAMDVRLAGGVLALLLLVLVDWVVSGLTAGLAGVA